MGIGEPDASAPGTFSGLTLADRGKTEWQFERF